MTDSVRSPLTFPAAWMARFLAREFRKDIRAGNSPYLDARARKGKLIVTAKASAQADKSKPECPAEPGSGEPIRG